MVKTQIYYNDVLRHEYINRTENAAFKQHYYGFNYRSVEYSGYESGLFLIIDMKTGEILFDDRY